MRNTPMHTRELPLKVSPWALFRVLARDERPFFIDAGRPWGSEWISSMGFRPRMQFAVRADDTRGALATLDDVLASIALSRRDHARARSIPFAGGAVVALAYEAGRETERIDTRGGDIADVPLLAAAVYDAVLAYDHRRERWTAATWHLGSRDLSRFVEEVTDAAADAERRATTYAAPLTGGVWSAARLAPSIDRDTYAARVARIREYIAAGDVYQVNLTERFETRLPAPAMARIPALPSMCRTRSCATPARVRGIATRMTSASSPTPSKAAARSSTASRKSVGSSKSFKPSVMAV